MNWRRRFSTRLGQASARTPRPLGSGDRVILGGPADCAREVRTDTPDDRSAGRYQTAFARRALVSRAAFICSAASGGGALGGDSVADRSVGGAPRRAVGGE